MDFSVLNDFFDKIYVINLARATDRKERFSKELKGLNYSIFYGKDKEDIDMEEVKREKVYDQELAMKHERYSKSLSPGALGCSWSHRLIYEDVIKNNYQKVLILEDDIVMNMKMKENWDSIFKEIPPDWELIYLGFSKNEKAPILGKIKLLYYHFIKFFGGIKFSHTTINNLYPKKLTDHIYIAGYHDCTHAYAITNTAAKTLLQLQTPISFYADNLLAHAVTNEMVKGYIVLPKLINQEYELGISSYSYVNH